nr:hypothetical protein [Tanacetum cinerariifolium]
VETHGIASLALFLGYGGSGDGYGSLPTDFGMVLLGKKREKRLYRIGREMDVHSVLKRYRVIGIIVCNFTYLAPELETRGIASLALFLGYGGSGDGYGSLPTDFGVVLLWKKREKRLYRIGREMDVHSVLKRYRVIGIIVCNFTYLAPE